MPEETASAGRSFWSGTISFGLVTVPVQLFAANRSGGVHWRMLDQDGTPLRRRYFCPDEGREVPPEELVRGYEIGEGEYVVVTDEELESLAPRKSRDIDLRSFVDVDQLDPLYFERSYFLTPDSESNKAYRLLAEAMERKKQAGIATFVLRDKEYLIAIISEGGILRAETLRFVDEVRTPEEVGLLQVGKADKNRVDEMLGEIKKIKEPKLKQALLENDYAERVQKLLEQKRKRHEDTVEVKPEPANADDGEATDTDAVLLSMLRKSLGGTGAGEKKRGRAGTRPAGGKRRASKAKAPAGRARTATKTRRKSA